MRQSALPLQAGDVARRQVLRPIAQTEHLPRRFEYAASDRAGSGAAGIHLGLRAAPDASLLPLSSDLSAHFPSCGLNHDVARGLGRRPTADAPRALGAPSAL